MRGEPEKGGLGSDTTSGFDFDSKDYTAGSSQAKLLLDKDSNA